MSSNSAPASPFIHISVISSLDCKYATKQAALISCSAGTGSTTTAPPSTSAATPPETKSTQSIPASTNAALAAVTHPARTLIEPHPPPPAFPLPSASFPTPYHPSSSPSRTVITTSAALFGHLSPITTPLSAVSKCTPKSLSFASLTQPLRLRVAKGANFTCVVRSKFGEKAALRGRGRGP